VTHSTKENSDGLECGRSLNNDKQRNNKIFNASYRSEVSVREARDGRASGKISVNDDSTISWLGVWFTEKDVVDANITV
jgi:hypothetical protein